MKSIADKLRIAAGDPERFEALREELRTHPCPEPRPPMSWDERLLGADGPGSSTPEPGSFHEVSRAHLDGVLSDEQYTALYEDYVASRS